MSNELNTHKTGRISPGLVLFLVFPLMGLLAAVMTVLSNGAAPRDNLTPMTPQGSVPRMNWTAPNMTLTALDGT
ncbi:MAG: hypothetical protein U0694_01995 [Anaerolineae bacterium]